MVEEFGLQVFRISIIYDKVLFCQTDLFMSLE